jgi:hypothetical protein
MIQDNAQEQELLRGYQKLRPESQRLIMATVITALTAESVVKRQYGLLSEGSPAPAVATEQDRTFG